MFRTTSLTGASDHANTYFTVSLHANKSPAINYNIRVAGKSKFRDLLLLFLQTECAMEINNSYQYYTTLNGKIIPAKKMGYMLIDLVHSFRPIPSRLDIFVHLYSPESVKTIEYPQIKVQPSIHSVSVSRTETPVSNESEANLQSDNDSDSIMIENDRVGIPTQNRTQYVTPARGAFLSSIAYLGRIHFWYFLLYLLVLSYITNFDKDFIVSNIVISINGCLLRELSSYVFFKIFVFKLRRTILLMSYNIQRRFFRTHEGEEYTNRDLERERSGAIQRGGYFIKIMFNYVVIWAIGAIYALNPNWEHNRA